MKPLRLEMQAFGPYVEKQVIDFAKLAEKGMFLIKGPTGSGKTTIFDAMTFALYGGSSGDDTKNGGRNVLEEWRCNQAEEDAETQVTFTFDVNGHTYRFKRGLVRKRKNLSPVLEAGEISEDGQYLPFFENPKIAELNKKAEDLIGLTRDQFRQVVLLPQGQFERFLTASSGEKEIILEKIFNAKQWKAYANQFFTTADARMKELEEIHRAVQQSLQEENMSDLTALGEKIQQLQGEKLAAKEAHGVFQGDKKQVALNADMQLVEQFKPLHQLEAKDQELKEKAASMQGKQIVYQQAEQAEALREVVKAYDDAEKESRKRGKAVEDLNTQIPDAKKAQQKAQETLEQHQAESPVEALQQQIAQLETKRGAYEAIGQLETDYNKKQSQIKIAEANRDRDEDAYQKCVIRQLQAYQKLSEAEGQAKDYRNRYFAGIYGTLAENLIEGEKCPVCGNTHHPEPAAKAADSVSKEDMEAKEAVAEQAKTAWEKGEETRAAAESAKNASADTYQKAKEACDEAKNKYESAKENLLEGIANLEALEGKIQKLQSQIQLYKDKTDELEEAKQEATNLLTKLLSQKDTAILEEQTAKAALQEAEATLRVALVQNGYDDIASVREHIMSAKARNALHTELVQYQRDCETVEQSLAEKRLELEGKIEPDSKQFKSRQSAITEENNTYQSKIASLDGQLTRLSRKLKDLSKKQESYESQIRQAEDDLAFAKKLRGDSSIGLHRYVLAIMFKQVVGEANRMLANVHGGRYHLFITNEKGSGNKRGLELKVHDNRSPEKEGRSVAMLSGGEKFLVSLALSIGMSTVAQKSGVRIEALFIDEGFGTLDNSSINDAMNVLASVGKNSGMIGIISHVHLLEEIGLAQLEVIKTENGSYIV